LGGSSDDLVGVVLQHVLAPGTVDLRDSDGRVDATRDQVEAITQRRYVSVNYWLWISHHVG